MRLLFVAKQTSLETSQLRDDRHFLVHTDTTDEALSILRHDSFDLVIVDVTSFSDTGFTFIRALRSARNDTPLVALTGRQPAERVRALGLGADDAISQPIDVGDLQARIAAVTRRYKGFGQSLLRVGPLTLSLESREVRFRDIPVHLSGKEYSVLELLVLRQGQVVTKEMFLNHLYGGMDEPETKIIDVFLCKLRRKLISVGGKGMIGTAWGQGYVLRAIGAEIAVPQVKVSAGARQHPAAVRTDLQHDYRM
jgi:two-component system, cell cycle response regulator CtrA